MRPRFPKFIGMMCLMMFALFASTVEVEAQQTRPKIAQMELAPGQDYIILTDFTGTQTYVALDSAFIEHSVRNLTYEDDTLCFEVYNAFLDELITTECVFVPEANSTSWITDNFLTFTGTDITVTETLPPSENVFVYANGVLLTPIQDYTLDPPNTITLEFTVTDPWLISVRYRIQD